MATSHTWKSGVFGSIWDPTNYVDGVAFVPGDTLIIDDGTPAAAPQAGANAYTLLTGNYLFAATDGPTQGLTLTNAILDHRSVIQETASGLGNSFWQTNGQFTNDGLVQIGTATQKGYLVYTGGSASGTAIELINNGFLQVVNGSTFNAVGFVGTRQTLINNAGALIGISGGSSLDWSGDYNAVNSPIVNNGSIVIQGGTGNETALGLAGDLTGTGVVLIEADPSVTTSNTQADIAGVLDSTIDIANGTLELNKAATGGSINFLNNTGALSLDGGPTYTYSHTPLPSFVPFGAAINGFKAGDTIKVEEADPLVSWGYVAATHTLIAYAADGSLRLSLVFGGTYTQSDFQVSLPTAASIGTFGGDFATITTTSTANTVAPHIPPAVTPQFAAEDPIFDTAYYLAHNPDVAASGYDPYQQFLATGWREGRNPSAAFDTRDYLAAYPDVAAAGIDPLLHYEQSGQAEGRSAFAVGTVTDPLVDPAYYYAHNPDVVAAGLDAATHYDASGWHENRNPDAFFDTSFYLKQNPDVAASGVDPLTHYELYGWHEGRNPSLLFSTSKYLSANPDVRAAGADPLLHFLQSGQREGRMAFLTGATAAPDPLVDAAYYDRQLGATLLPTGAAAASQAAAGYELTGWPRGLNPDAFFNTSYYLAQNPDVAAAHLDPLAHYEQFGWHEGRDPSASFSTSKYLAAYGDVRAAGLDPLAHFLQYGQAEGRTAFAV